MSLTGPMGHGCYDCSVELIKQIRLNRIIPILSKFKTTFETDITQYFACG